MKVLFFLPSFFDLGLPMYDIDQSTNLKPPMRNNESTIRTLCTNLETTCDVVDAFEVIIDSVLSLVRVKKNLEKSS
jgi:hypothetical protein